MLFFIKLCFSAVFLFVLYCIGLDNVLAGLDTADRKLKAAYSAARDEQRTRAAAEPEPLPEPAPKKRRTPNRIKRRAPRATETVTPSGEVML